MTRWMTHRVGVLAVPRHFPNLRSKVPQRNPVIVFRSQ